MACGIGIDVSKDKVDVASSDGAVRWTVGRTPAALRKLAEELAEGSAHRVVVEASGGYAQAVLVALYAAGTPVVLVQPARARSFAKALGRRAKTDRIDAAVLALMAVHAVGQTPLWEPLSDELATLRGLVFRRKQLVDFIDAETTRRRAGSARSRHELPRSGPQPPIFWSIRSTRRSLWATSSFPGMSAIISTASASAAEPRAIS